MCLTLGPQGGVTPRHNLQRGPPGPSAPCLLVCSVRSTLAYHPYQLEAVKDGVRFPGRLGVRIFPSAPPSLLRPLGLCRPAEQDEGRDQSPPPPCDTSLTHYLACSMCPGYSNLFINPTNLSTAWPLFNAVSGPEPCPLLTAPGTRRAAEPGLTPLLLSRR